MLLRARDCTWTFPRPVLLMGVVNVTPDSFSDGGLYFNPAAAVEHALELVAEGADIIDVGGESTRPGASPVPEPEELRRVLPVLERLARRIRVPISIDTMKPAVARAALQAGASLINDVAANRQDEAMWRVAAEFGAGYVLMHMLGTPQDMQQAPSYGDVVAEVDAFFGERLQRIAGAGLAPEQVILDVGIGFGKTREHNLQLLARLDSFTSWSRPLLLGASRKSIIPQVTGADPATDRLAGSLACACWGVQQGANILRIHDVAATRQAVQLIEAIRAQSRTSQPAPERRNDEKA
jgi:dihydropteroate synthase